MVQGAVASLVLVLLDALDTVQGHQLCHMRSVIMVLCSRMIRSHLHENGDLEEAEHSAKQWRHLNSERKMGDEAIIKEYASLVKIWYKVLGERCMEIAKLCFDTTRDVTWVFTPMSLNTYFRDQGRVENKAEKQGRLQQLCIEEFEEYVTALCKRDQGGPFLKRVQKALARMRNRITDGGKKTIPVLNFFIATLVQVMMDFMSGDISAMAERPMPIKPPAKGNASGNGTLSLNSIAILYFKHERETGQYVPTTLDDHEKDIPLMLYQSWSKYHPGQNGSGVQSTNDEAYILAMGKRFGELLVRYLVSHPAYPDSVEYDRDEMRKILEEICGRKASADASQQHVEEFSFNPFGENASLIDLWDQAQRTEPNLGAGGHKPLDTIVRGKIYKETTEPTAWNIDHIFGSTGRQIEQWIAHTMDGYKKAGNPDLGYYSVVASSTTLPCETEEEATAVANNKDTKKKKNFIKAHPELTTVLGLSWKAAFA